MWAADAGAHELILPRAAESCTGICHEVPRAGVWRTPRRTPSGSRAIPAASAGLCSGGFWAGRERFVSSEYVSRGNVWIYCRGVQPPSAACYRPTGAAGGAAAARARVAGGMSVRSSGRSPPCPQRRRAGSLSAPASIPPVWQVSRGDCGTACNGETSLTACFTVRAAKQLWLFLLDEGRWRSLQFSFCCCLRSFVTVCCILSWVQSQVLKKDLSAHS